MLRSQSAGRRRRRRRRHTQSVDTSLQGPNLGVTAAGRRNGSVVAFIVKSFSIASHYESHPLHSLCTLSRTRTRRRVGAGELDSSSAEASGLCFSFGRVSRVCFYETVSIIRNIRNVKGDVVCKETNETCLQHDATVSLRRASGELLLSWSFLYIYIKLKH